MGESSNNQTPVKSPDTMEMDTVTKQKRPKHRPQEISSKQPISVLRQVIAPVRKRAMDPRFDRTFGKFEEAGFNQAYSFIGEIQKNEQKILEKEMNKECDVERRESLKRLYDRLGDMQRAKQQVLERKQIVKDHLKSEKVLVEQGKKPFYLRKSDVERLHLSKQFEKIKKKVKSDKDLERILEKRRKRKDSRQRKHIPLQ